MQIAGQIFTGVLDTDSDPRVVSQEDYTYANAVLNGLGERLGSLVFAKGTLPYDLELPEGENDCIGTCEDKQNAALFIFVYNSNEDHSIYKYRLLTDDHLLIARGPALGFQANWRINHAKVVDGELLYWTDAVESSNEIEGNPPRKINAVKADITKENYTYELYADIASNDPFALGNTYYFSVIENQDPNQETDVNVFESDGTYAGDPAGGLEWLLTQLEAAYPGLTFEYCDGCKIKITIPSTVGRFYFEPSATDTLMVGTNIYPITLETHHIDMLKVPPSCAPSAIYINDPDVSTNNVSKMCAQFRVRYIYDDYERSAWGPVSNVALNIGIDGEPVQLLNAIKVTFTDEKFQDPSWMTMIRQVEVAFRDGNENDWRLVGRFDVCEIGITTQEVRFYNDKQYSVLPSDDLSTPSTLQVLKPFDFLPIRSLCMDATANGDGNTLMFLGANQENYDNPDCINMEVEAIPQEDDCLIDIVGTVEIVNDANFPSANPDFSHYPLNGIVVYLAGTPYYAISNNPADGSGDGSFRISGVPRGRYILRAASYKCSFNNDLGAIYNLSNGLEWQRTSAPVIEMAGSLGLGLQYERRLDLDPDSFTGTEFDLDTEVGYGTIQIQNGHWTKRLIWDSGDETPQDNHAEAYVFNEFYLLDNDQTIPNHATDDTLENYDAMKSAIGVERQTVTLKSGNIVHPDVDLYTDHNGYCFYGEYSPEDDDEWYVVQLEVNGNLISLAAEGPVYPGAWENVYGETITNKWAIGSLAGLALYDPPNTAIDPPLYYTQTFLIFNNDAMSIVGPNTLQVSAVIDDNVTGLDNVIFLYSRTGRVGVTGIDGVAQIQYYIPFDTAPDRDDDAVWPLYLPDICYDGYPVNDIVVVEAQDPIADPFIVPSFQFLLANIDFEAKRYLKGGGEYSFGIVYEDRGNRTPGAIFGAKLRIPVHIDGLTKWQARWRIYNQPPDWATHYRIVRLKNAVHSMFVQWTIPEVRYVRIPSQLENPITTTFAAGNATHVLFRLYSPITIDPSSDPQMNLFFDQEGQQGYAPQLGDRVRLILDGSGAPVNTAARTVEGEIVGIYIDGADQFAIIPATAFGALEVTAGALAEYYTPVTGAPEIYYEGGEDCYEIGDPGTEGRYHKGPEQDQIPAAQAAVGIYTGGDTYWRRQKFTQTGVYETEHQTPSRYIDSVCQDIGRPFALSTDIQQEYYNTRIRVSGSFVQNSAINNLSAFAALDFKDVNRQWGTIMFLGFVNNVLLAICKFKVQPIYVGKGELLYLSGESNVGRSDQIMEIADESVTDYGTHDPSSVVIEGSHAYFWDKFQGAVCRYAQNGVVPITSKMVKFFNNYGKQQMANVGTTAIGGYDREHRLYFLTLDGTTISYDEIKGGWSSFWPIAPSAYGRIGQKMYWINDQAIFHKAFEDASQYSYFFGIQYDPQVTFVINQDPALVKRFKSIRINSDRKWHCPQILVPANNDYSGGQESKLLANRFNSYEGQWRAEFLRDMNDTNSQFTAIVDATERAAAALLRGRELKGEYMVVVIEAASGANQTILSRVDVYFIPSMVSNP